MAFRSSFTKPGNGIELNQTVRGRGAEPPKKESGSTGADSSEVLETSAPGITLRHRGEPFQ